MAKRVVTATDIELDFGGGFSNFNAQCSEASLSMEADKVDATSFDSGGWEEYLSGIKRATLTLNLRKDSDLSGLDLSMWTAFTTGASVDFQLHGAAGTPTAANARYDGAFRVLRWNPINGAVGSLFEDSVTFDVNAPGGGVAAITREVT